MSNVRLIDCEPRNSDKDEVIVRDEQLPQLDSRKVIGRDVKPVTVAYLKREASAKMSNNSYRALLSWERSPNMIPEGTKMSQWKHKARDNCLHYFEKVSLDGRYRIELEIN